MDPVASAAGVALVHRRSALHVPAAHLDGGVYNGARAAHFCSSPRDSHFLAMRILLSNDDGYFSPGLERLAADVAAHADITVVAPERDRSGASNSLTLDRPLTVRRAPNGFLFVNGTPTDCVHLAVTGLLDDLPDMVISGINHGANMGDDTIYSGTVAAAMEGYLLGIPSIAVSLANKAGTHFETASKVIVDMLNRHRRQPAGAWLLNVNVPDVPYPQLKGERVTRLGKRHKAEPVVKTQTPRGETCYWVGAAGAAADAGEGTDFDAVERGYVSVTPLQIDLTSHGDMPRIVEWLSARVKTDADA
jgi:5'-nucleotidase